MHSTHTHIHTHTQNHIHTHAHTQTHRHTDRQTDRQTDRHTHTHGRSFISKVQKVTGMQKSSNNCQFDSKYLSSSANNR